VIAEITLPVLTIGQPAPIFRLTDLHGHPHALNDYLGRIVVLQFWSAECPWVDRADQLLAAWQSQWGKRVVVLPIAANASEPREMIWKAAAAHDLTLVLQDDCQRTADLYGATNTPHFYVIDERGFLRYQGGLDDVTFRQRTASRYFVREAVDALLAGRDPEVPQTQPYGCTVVRSFGES
jgi:peroxiredoxin